MADFLLQFIVYKELLVKSSQNLHGGSVSEAKVISESNWSGGGERLFVFRLVWMGTLLKSNGA